MVSVDQIPDSDDKMDNNLVQVLTVKGQHWTHFSTELMIFLVPFVIYGDLNKLRPIWRGLELTLLSCLRCLKPVVKNLKNSVGIHWYYGTL